jgi:hypothetical protein
MGTNLSEQGWLKLDIAAKRYYVPIMGHNATIPDVLEPNVLYFTRRRFDEVVWRRRRER